MGLPPAFLALLLLRSVLSLTDETLEGYDLSAPEDESEIEAFLDRHTRNGDKFLRFGRAFWDYDSGSDTLYNDKQLQERPSRTGSFTGDPKQRTERDQSSFLRFGRSVGDGNKKKRDKRQISTSEALKRHENFLRFGRTSNSNFMRFGRNLGGTTEAYSQRPTFDSHNNFNMLSYLRHLLRQSEENNSRHRN